MVEIPPLAAPPAIEGDRSAPAPAAVVLPSAITGRETPFTCAELAAVLHVEPETVAQWCRSGWLLGAAKVGRAGWRIPASAVVAMLETPGGRGAAGRADGAPPGVASPGGSGA